MKTKIILLMFISIFFFTNCKKEDERDSLKQKEMSATDIDPNSINTEALRYYENMAKFVKLTTSNIDGKEASRLKTAMMLEEQDQQIEQEMVNSVLAEFVSIEIEDEEGREMSFFDLREAEREVFLDEWSTVNASEMTEKLEEPEIGKELEEYISIQNIAFDETIEELANGDY